MVDLTDASAKTTILAAGEEAPVKEKKAFEAPPGKVEGYDVAFVGNIAWEISKLTLEDLFASFEPKFVRMFDDPVTKKHRGFAHIHFKDGASLDKCVSPPVFLFSKLTLLFLPYFDPINNTFPNTN